MIKRLVTSLALLATLATPVVAQDKMMHTEPPSDLMPLLHQYLDWFVKGAEQMPEANYSFKPTPEIRSFGELVGHMANSNFMICAGIRGEKSPATADFEKVMGKAALVKGVKDALAYCHTVQAWAKDHAHDNVDLFGMKGSVTWALAFNIAHNAEHYGNMVSYMRMKGMTPPSSQGN
jgi:uncharacterized damage-inducible protein DinB